MTSVAPAPVEPSAAPAADHPERADWVDLLAQLTIAFAAAADRGGSPARAQLPGAPLGDVVPSMEGFARMSVAWGAWLGLASNPPRLTRHGSTVDVDRLMVAGLLDGTSDGPRGWGPIADRDQRIVEAAELATGLWLGRERLVPLLGRDGLAAVLRWLSEAHGRDLYDDNWHLFPAVVATVRRGLGETVPDRLIDGGLDRLQAWYRGDGWYTDGPGQAFDSYTGWAIHWHQLLWASIDGRRRTGLRRLVIERASTFMASSVALVAANGSRPLQGRSLGYRFADVAPYALAELLGFGAVRPGLARRLAGSRIRYHLDAGALDPETGWFRRGVAAERPSVLERYLSAGAAAWAAHGLVALGLPPNAPFWTARSEPLPVERGDGSLALRGPGFLIGWRRATGETWLHNSRAGHPTDIPGHDYGPYYGKLAYRSHFPVSIRAAGGGPTPDDGILIEARGPDGTPIRGVRGETEAGDAGPGWTWSRYVIDTGARHRLTTVVLPWRSVEVRLTGVVPGGPIRIIEGSAAIGGLDRNDVERFGSPSDLWQAARAPSGFVAIRALAGYTAAHESEPAGDGPDLNLVADHAETPTVAEDSPSSRGRIVASVATAVAAAGGELEELHAISISEVSGSVVRVLLGAEEIAVVALGTRLSALETGGARAVGRLRVLRWRTDGSAWAGEAVIELEGVIRLDSAGPVRVARIADGRIEVTALDGFEIEPTWAGDTGKPWQLQALDVADWRDEGPADRGPGVSRRVIRRLQRKLGRRLVTMLLSPADPVMPGVSGRGRKLQAVDRPGEEA